MISQSTIQNLAQKLQSTELNIRREYIQHLFLSYFYQQPDSDKIYFKGGTALRIIYQSPRFSEDLDFSSSATTINKIEDILVQTTREIEREGIEVDIKVAKSTSGGYLSIVNFLLGDQEVAIQLEVSQRAGKNAIKKVNELLEKTNIHFEHELKQFLPKSHWTVIRNFKSSLQQEIQRSV